jgi:hypothetical protein
MKSKKKNIERDTPIRDGDTRPDQNIEGNTQKQSSPLASDKSKFTKERAADINSLEDYKDAK